ncbi:putative secreted protein (Por secretion system target) [Ulvibacter sp. MAR_2010_11]|uniref:VPS10 domain-containing protein n=1 Tax=Ulvibacter sp. MAR_2010_11 TaxID=1250229 RepID=UPI000C2C4B1E|nr:T9SS type A sorting domain-containing protein [Ulvibacter sp. MAR_2010_11]PKA82811.1 putative secreted protein (Por secretion system target) [Ulvibacter sp. MAR_2010_11]
MKKLSLLLFLIVASLGTSISCVAQISFEGVQDFGRIYDITYHPTIQNKVYALSQGSHILESNDNGQTWTILYSYPQSGIALQRLEFLNGNSLSYNAAFSYDSSANTVYIFDLDTNSISKQYNPPTSGGDKEWVASFDIYAANTDIAIIHQGYKIGASNYAKVYYTADGGQSWTEIYYNENYDSVFPNNVAISPGDPTKLFIARGEGPTAIDGGLFYSEDTGATWTEKLAGNAFGPIRFHPVNPDIILLGTFIGNETSHTQNLFQSVDGGATWNAFPIVWSDYILDNIVDIRFDLQNPDNIIVLEENEVVLTTDGGANWQNFVYPDDNPYDYYYGLKASFNPFQSQEIMISANYYPMFSTDGGQSMSQLLNPFYPVTFVQVVPGSEPMLYYSVQSGITNRNLVTNAAESYDIFPINYISVNDEPAYFVDKYIDGRVYSFSGGFMGVNLFVSDDNGQNKTPVYTDFFVKASALATVPNNLNTVWLGLYDAGVRVIDFNDLNNVIVTTPNLPVSGIVTSIHIDEVDTNLIHIAIGAKIYQSVDGGANWELKNNGINLDPNNDLIFDFQQSPFHPNEYTIATSQGVYRSTDSSESWSQIYVGQNVRKIEYSEIAQNHIVASIYTSQFTDAQIVYSDTSGETWTEVPFEAIEYVGSNAMDYLFHEDSVDVYIGTYDLGVVKYTIALETLGNPEPTNPNLNVIVTPNPAQDVLFVNLKQGSVQKLTIISLTGQLQEVEYNESGIDVSHLPTGIYFIRVTGTSGDNFLQKFIKM